MKQRSYVASLAESGYSVISEENSQQASQQNSVNIDPMDKSKDSSFNFGNKSGDLNQDLGSVD